MYNLSQKLTAEFLGTFALIFFGAGSVCVDFQLRSNSTGGIGLLTVALAHGLAIAIMVSALGHISGGHFNPAVTIGFWVTKRVNTLDALSYWAAQLFGATAAAFLLKVVLPEETWRNAFRSSCPISLAGLAWHLRLLLPFSWFWWSSLPPLTSVALSEPSEASASA